MGTKHLTLLTVLMIFNLHDSVAQIFKLDADFRARFEYRHGFNNLFPDDADPAAFVRQRARLNFVYDSDKIKAMVSFQDVSTWGDTRQILPSDNNNSFGLAQAWVEVVFNENWSSKLGRQVISYDDQRIFGGLDWAMQGRFHDAALLKYKKKGLKIDIGAAFSQEGEPIVGSGYNITGFFSYKTMLFTHLAKAWEKSKISVLLLNNGFQKYDQNQVPDGVYYRNTVGSFFTFPISKLNLIGSFYYQYGKANATTDLSAYQFSLESTYKARKTVLGLGFETMSGTNQDGSDTNSSFFPLYGTNHKFNGFMDYFYVGNHANNVGLNDIYSKAVIATGEKSNLLLKSHFFMSQADLIDNSDKYLGTEVDLVFTVAVNKFTKLNVGYSQMFAGDSMGLIKGGLPTDNTNNWGWVQLIVKPTFFKHTFKDEN